jgi:hypothetical protein
MMERWNNMEPDFPIDFPVCSNMFQYFTILAVWCRNGVRMVSEDLGCTCQAKLKLATDELDSKAVQ